MRRLLLGSLLLCLSVLMPAFGHQQKAAITTVLFNARTSHIEVMHKFFLHDAEHAVRSIFGQQADILRSKDTQKTFSDYVARRFELLKEGKPLPLSKVGFEVEGKFFWVYQETDIPVELHNLSVRHNALRELWPSQINTVNIEGKSDKVETLTFSGATELLSVEFN
ncbi:DUF6702 family protein [Neptunicella sp. SCSIO 80796]|uniref:DUF6702 family protein n=1 Tax=Neptunicella plasticusilytica TaxID=3117012 RepID=UPI003A4DA02D